MTELKESLRRENEECRDSRVVDKRRIFNHCIFLAFIISFELYL
jgi:hypothetical protein